MSKYEPVSAEVVAALQTALGAEYVRTDAETLEKYKTDEETDPRYHHLPEVVVWPGSTEEVAAVMKIANQYNAVSYTHLDVYKRQFLMTVSIRRTKDIPCRAICR